jgi:hypothetical protein
MKLTTYSCNACSSTDITVTKTKRAGVCSNCGRRKPIAIWLSRVYPPQICKSCHIRLWRSKRAVKK